MLTTAMVLLFFVTHWYFNLLFVFSVDFSMSWYGSLKYSSNILRLNFYTYVVINTLISEVIKILDSRP